jgi:hypothetical protein
MHLEPNQSMPSYLNFISWLKWTWLTCCVVGLAGCSLVVTGYNNAPRWLMFTWVNPHLDLNSAQEVQVLNALQAQLTWHRQTQLPDYIVWLQRMQALAKQNIQADQVCGLFEDMRDSLPPMLTQMEEPITQLAMTLTPQQLTHLKKKLDTHNQTWRRDWKLGEPQTVQWDVQAEKGLDNAERLYGKLNKQQRLLLRELVVNSGYDPDKTYQERLRQQADAVQVLQRIAMDKPDVTQARELIHAWMGRLLNTPDPAYAAYLKKRQRLNCEATAQLHNTTTPEQRTQAVKVLKGYEEDVRELIKQGS